MDDNKRILLAFLLAFLILFIWRALVFKTPPSRPSAPTPPPSPTSRTQAQGGGVASANPTSGPTGQKAFPPLPVEQGQKVQELTVENDDYRITMSTQGAVIRHWILNRYRDAEERPLDVVNQLACAQLGYPMSLTLADPSLTDKVNHALYVSSATGPNLKTPVTVEFTYSDGATAVKKTFSFGTGYEVHVSVRVFNGRGDLPVEVAWPGGFGDNSLPPNVEASHSMAVYGDPGDFTTVPQKKVKEPRLVPGPFTVAGLEDLYFVGVFLPDSPETEFRFSSSEWHPANEKEKDLPHLLEARLGTLQAKPLSFRLLVAPKDLDVLRAAQPNLDGLVNFGWFSFIAKPLFLGLRYIYDHWAHNWGWAIVILTVILNFTLFPLKLKSIRSAQEMQKVQPIIKSIQDKYKQYKINDPRKQRMNQEIMKVYQEHGINPLGGCLPMALQIPILYGFYELLETAIELRHAPWFGCVRDLSMPDTCHLAGIPLAVLPTIMIIATFVQQKITPTPTADPGQQRMMMLMPIFIGFIFYRLASGLVLYYLAASVVGIFQQLIINRFMPLPQKAAASPAAGDRPKQPPKPVGVKE
jgi:YidC/Oxa1 family membrane protein insertase